MYRFSPISALPPQYSSVSDNLVYPHSRLTSANGARERYLTALAEVKAAEADFIAAEAVQQEEALLRRLEEIQHQKRRDGLLHSNHRHSVLVTPALHLDDSAYSLGIGRHSSFDSQDRLALLRREVQEEELRRAVAVRQRQRELDAGILRRKEIEEAKLLALKRKQEEEKLKELACLRREAEARLFALRQAQKAEEVKRTIVQRPNSVRLSLHIPSEQKDSLKVSQRQPTASSKVRQESHCSEKYQQCYEQPKQERCKSKTLNSEPADGAQVFANFLNMLAQAYASASATTPSRERSPEEPKNTVLHNTPEQFVRSVFHPQRERGATQGTPTKAAAEANTTSPHSKATESESTAPETLKEQLEARLNNDQSVEIRDTVQAILASLADNIDRPSSSVGNAGHVSTASSSKGKEKASAPVAPAEVNPTSHEAMDTVRNIEASFLALQNEFVFPSQLDFSPAPSPTSSPVSSDTESITATIPKLAYTSRNHPVRYYEQALSGLLSQLDSVESFGNSDLRIKRKDVVGRVERALEELEREVEGRWKHKLAKDAKAAKEQSDKEGSHSSDAASVPSAVPSSPDSLPVGEEPAAIESAPLPEHGNAVLVPTEDNKSATTSVEQAEGGDSPKDTPSDSTDAIDVVAPAELERSEDNDAPVVVEKEVLEVSSALESKVTGATLPSSTTEGEISSSISSESSVSESDEEDQVAEESADLSSSDILTETTSCTPSYPPTLTSSYPPALPLVPSEAESSVSSSVATVRPYDIDTRADDEVDTFLLPASSEDNSSKDLKNKDDDQEGDVGSDWSEVDA